MQLWISDNVSSICWRPYDLKSSRDKEESNLEGIDQSLRLFHRVYKRIVANQNGNSSLRRISRSQEPAVNIVLQDQTVASGSSLTIDGGIISSGPIVINAANETDGTINLIGGDAGDSLTGGVGSDTITGNSGPDLLIGGRGDDQIYGGKGKDRIFGGSGNDFIDGGPGRDKLYGDEGADTYLISEGKDKIMALNLAEGDTIQIPSSVEFIIAQARKKSKIIHADGTMLVKNILASDLESVIVIVE